MESQKRKFHLRDSKRNRKTFLLTPIIFLFQTKNIRCYLFNNSYSASFQTCLRQYIRCILFEKVLEKKVHFWRAESLKIEGTFTRSKTKSEMSRVIFGDFQCFYSLFLFLNFLLEWPKVIHCFFHPLWKYFVI